MSSQNRRAVDRLESEARRLLVEALKEAMLQHTPEENEFFGVHGYYPDNTHLAPNERRERRERSFSVGGLKTTLLLEREQGHSSTRTHREKRQ